MEMLPAVLGSLVTALPSLTVYVALLVVAVTRWNRHPRTSMLASTSAVMMMVIDLLSRMVFAILPMKLMESGRTAANLSVIYTILGGLGGVLHAVALGLLVMAVFSERGQPAPTMFQTR
jgi:uncharacterized membrane protein